MTDTETLKKSLLMIKKLKHLLAQQQEKVFDPIAIIGMSCRVPQASNLQEFWQLLRQGKNIISALPEARWELLKETEEPALREHHLAYWGGHLDNIDAFDAYFFGISPREALRMDPQQRLLLEVAYETFEDAGLTIEDLSGTNTGVFSSLYASQFSHLQTLDSDMDALFIPTGSAVSIAANRLSYLFDLRGPSLTLDTACSSSLIAIQLACLNLQAKLCEQALVSAVNINLLPSIHATLAKATMLSPTGQCHTFDAQADGYVQGEGAGAILLKPLTQALADKDRIYAVLMGGAINQDGKTNGLTAPNGLQQEQLLRTAYRAANIEPTMVSYVECHGTGTFLGDPIEVQALGEVIGKNRDPQKPCWISSVKTNIGHLEPAAGILSVIKTALILKNGAIPSHLNLTAANPHIPFAKYGFTIPQQLEPLPKYGKNEIAVAGVSGFGFGGANAHLVLRELSLAEQFIPSQPMGNEQELFTLSAKDKGALMRLVTLWGDFLKNNAEISLAQICYNVHLRRSHYAHRLAIIAHSLDDLYQKLKLIQIDNHREHQAIFLSPENKKANKASVISEFALLDLTTLATHYVNQALIDWKKYEAERFYPSINMPLYPWQRKKYWPHLGNKTPQATHCAYPLQGQRLASPLAKGQFEFIFNTKTLPEIKDTFHVIHAGYYLDMLSYAMNQLEKQTEVGIENLHFLSPLLVLDGSNTRVQLIIDNESQSFSIYSNDGSEHWIEHAKGKLSTNHPAENNIIAPANEKLTNTAESFYQRVTSMGMPAGDTIRWIEHYWVEGRVFFSRLRPPQSKERGSQFMMKMHPGIIDACIQTLFFLLPQEHLKPYVASHMGNVVFYQLQQPAYIYTQLKEILDDGKKIIGDCYLLDQNQCILMQCTDLCLTQLGDRMEVNDIADIKREFELDLSLPYATCRDALIQFLTTKFATIFSMPIADINVHHSLHELGMDSLMAMAIIRIIESNFGISYSIPLMMQGPSIHEIAEQVLANKTEDQPIHESRSQPPLETLWIANRKPQTHAKYRLFCFPYGGGGSSIYREWQAELSPSIEVCPIQLPGRENRLNEQPVADINPLIASLAQQLLPYFDLPFAFFGHSFGALIAFELTRYLRRQHLPQPTHLFASAYPDPCIPSKSLDNLIANLNQRNLDLFTLNQEQIAHLSEEQLSVLAAIFKENGIVDYSDERMNKNIIQVLLPIFIGDMNIVKSYSYYEEAPLNLHGTIFLGEQDTWVTPEDHQSWTRHFTYPCQFVSFDRGHLFIRENDIRLQVIQKIKDELLMVLSTAIYPKSEPIPVG